jgi:3-phosphoshikimate 1-carboxyvinyltransferase
MPLGVLLPGAGAIKGGTVKVTGIGRNSVQGDIRFADVLEKMGAVVTWGDDFISCTHGELNAIDMDMNHIPDAAMTIATAALFAKGTTTLRNIYNWRVKETDRLFAMATELRKVGAEVEEGEDYIRVTPPAKLQFAEIGTYNDHRMAMCFSLVALSDTPVTILDPKCTAKTFPDYFRAAGAHQHAGLMTLPHHPMRHFLTLSDVHFAHFFYTLLQSFRNLHAKVTVAHVGAYNARRSC